MSIKPNSARGADLAERVRSILASKHLTLSQISQLSAARFGRSSPYFLPHTLYHEFRLGTFSPSLHQVFALSQISGYRFSDWLRVLGCDLEDIPRLQVLLPSKRTMLLDSSLVDADAWIPWFRNRARGASAPPIAPLAQLLEVTAPRRLRFLSEIGNRGFLYARIGRQDALAFPDLIPGSIVRVNPRFSNGCIPKTNGATSTQIFLIEHNKGPLLLPLACCRKGHHRSDRYVALLCPSRTESSTRGADSRRCGSRNSTYASDRAAGSSKGPGKTLETATACHGQEIWPTPPRLTHQAASVSAGGCGNESQHRSVCLGMKDILFLPVLSAITSFSTRHRVTFTRRLLSARSTVCNSTCF